MSTFTPNNEHHSLCQPSETILVIDDDRELSYYVAKRLLPSFGYKTLQAFNGRDGLNIIRSTPPDLMLVDLQLPDMDGLELLRTLTSEGIRIPAILSTGHGSEQVAVDAFRIGVQDYLSKPVQPEILRQVINRILSQKRIQEEKARLTAQLTEQVAWLKTLFRVGKSVTSTLEVDEVLRRIVEAGVSLTKAEEGFLALIDPRSGQLYLRASKNIEDQRTKTVQLQISDSRVGEVVTTKKPIRVARRIGDPTLKVSTGYLVSSLLHVPILSKGESLGVLSVDHQTSFKTFTERDEFLLTSLADYAAIALENSRLYEQSQIELSERLRAEAALRESEERYSLAVKGTNEGIWDWNLITNYVYYSPRWKSNLGYQEEEIASSPNTWFDLVHSEDRQQLKMAIAAHLQGDQPHFEYEHRMLHKDGTYRWILTRGLAVRDPSEKPVRMAGSQTDITDRKHAEERLTHNAFYDILTGLPNRALLLDRLRQVVSRKKRWPDKSYYVLFLDLDRFKFINDSLGHGTGDQILVAVASKLQAAVRNMDTVARFGGDEFVLLIEDIQGPDYVKEIMQRIMENLSRPICIKDQEIIITASIGVVSGDIEYEDAEQLLRDADIAMYSAKSQGRNRYEIFKLELRSDFLEQLSLENALRHAIQVGELRLVYQPIVSLKTGKLAGFEALVRWQHPTKGLLYPGAFIKLAEDRGLILAIDRWVLQNASQKIRDWLLEFPDLSDLTMSVNLSTKYLQQINLVEEVEAVLKHIGLDGKHLKLEITESGIMENSQQIRAMIEGLRSLGVDIRIDDFGTGYSSLAYLHQFQVQALKIDRFFVSNLDSGEHSPGFIRTVLSLAHELGLTAIAEGVENQNQLEQLQILGCEFGQGFHISMPLKEEDAFMMLQRSQIGSIFNATQKADLEAIPSSSPELTME